MISKLKGVQTGETLRRNHSRKKQLDTTHHLRSLQGP